MAVTDCVTRCVNPRNRGRLLALVLLAVALAVVAKRCAALDAAGQDLWTRRLRTAATQWTWPPSRKYLKKHVPVLGPALGLGLLAAFVLWPPGPAIRTSAGSTTGASGDPADGCDDTQDGRPPASSVRRRHNKGENVAT